MKYKTSLLRLFVLCIAVRLPLIADAGQMGAMRDLDSVIPSVDLQSGSQTIGGASIEDAVALLRRWAAFPVCIELREFTRAANGLTLSEALDELHRLQAEGKLGPSDAARLEAYGQMIVTSSPAAVIGFKQKTFHFVAHDISVRSFLDRITDLDADYVWINYGTPKKPLIVIQPRMASVLEFPVPKICADVLARSLYSALGKVTAIMQAHEINRGESNPAERAPDITVDLCHEHLKARDVLNLTIEATGDNESWSLSGIKEMRFLTFEQAH